MKNSIQALYYYLKYPLVHFASKWKFYFGSNAALQNYLRRVDRVYLPGLLRNFGATIGLPINFNGSVIIDNSSLNSKPFSNLLIGKKCFIGTDVFFDLPEKIILEDEVVISAGVKLLTHQDTGDRMMSKYYPRKAAGIIIGEGSWIGANVIILAGVSIGKCCVVAAGSVVVNSIEDYDVVGGIPAKVIKKLEVKI